MRYEQVIGFGDVDFARTPFYGRYFAWLEHAWESYLHQCGIWYSEMIGERGFGLPVTELTCSYRRPMALDDRFAVDFRLVELTRKGLRAEFRFVLLEGESVTCEGSFRRRFVDMRRFRGTELPDDLYERFSELADRLADWPDLRPVEERRMS